MKPHDRIDPVGRACMICGHGDNWRGLGPCWGAGMALWALGYDWDRTKSIGYAHRKCLDGAKTKTQQEKT
jgi:hypothetical protein